MKRLTGYPAMAMVIAILIFATDLSALAAGAEINFGSEPVVNNSEKPLELNLADAIELALNHNLATQIASERKEEARGRKLESMVGLMPNLAFTISQSSITQNLAANGLNTRLPNISSFVGPFTSSDSRFRVSQSIFNLSAIRRMQAGKREVNIASYQELLAREQVANLTANSYLKYLRAEQAIAAAEANIKLAESLRRLASDQRDAGVATGVDVARAESRLAAEQVKLARAETEAITAKLQLQRVTGIPLGTAIKLVDQLSFTNSPLPSIDIALSIAEQQRVELKIAAEQVHMDELKRKSAQAELYPTVDFVSDYGVSGNGFTESLLPTRSAGVRVNIPIFNGGASRSRIIIANSRKRQAQLQLDDLRIQVSEEVRLSLQTIETTAEQVRAAELALTLAERELKMARDRFAAGVGDNVEVINAQTVLANARDARVAALADYNSARVNLAAALGQATTFQW